MKGALIFVGNELLSGAVLNTNSFLACQKLSQEGYSIKEMVTLPDEVNTLVKYLKSFFKKYEFILVSGGLGPTDDDITNLAVAKAFNLPLVKNSDFISAILSSKEYKFSQEIAQKMALLPEGALTLSKNLSMAGYYLELNQKLLFFLPGVPEQFNFLLETEVLPILKKKNPPTTQIFTLSFRFFDLCETDLNLFLNQLKEKKLYKSVEIGYYPVFPEVKLVLKGKKEELLYLETFIKEKFSHNIVSTEDENLPLVIGKVLTQRGENLSVAESCSGGYLSSLITSISGSSQYFERGFITYSPLSKIELLGVKEETLEKFGVVSFETALEMAEGAKRKAKTDYALSLTGIAGPTGGTEETPTGTVFIGIACKNSSVRAYKFKFPGNRREIQIWASYTALDILRRTILYGKSLFSYRFALGTKEKNL